MMALILIAVIAGCASALMFASIISGALISLVLICLAPTPLMVAAVAWGPLCAAVGGLAAMVGLGAVFGLPIAISYGLAVALPAWWLGHLVLLGRPLVSDADPADATPAAGPELEWYPIGRILLWIAALVVLISMAVLLTIGTDAATINETLRQRTAQSLQIMSGSAVSASDPAIQSFAAIVPILIAMSGMTTITLNLLVAVKVAATSGRLRRPWPDLTTTALPPMTLAALCIALAFCFSGGMIAILSKVIATALMTAYALTGFAVLHILTRYTKGRAFWLGTAYAVVVMFVWPVIAMVILGLADAVFGLRERFLHKQPPPLPTP
jgi:hypothetical protein